MTSGLILIKAQQIMKAAADSKGKEDSFEMDDLVYLKLQPFRRQSMARFYGSYCIIKKRQSSLPASTPSSSCFAVKTITWLNSCVPGTSIAVTSDLELLVEPESLLEVRQVNIGNTLRLEALIKWKKLPAFEATREDVQI